MKYYTTTTEYNCGIDLHTRQMYICVMNRAGEVLVHRNIRDNDFEFFLKLVEPYRHDLTVTCESCFVCFWLADAFEDARINFVLAHAYYVKSIAANKHKNDTEAKPESQPTGLERPKGTSTRMRGNWPNACAPTAFPRPMYVRAICGPFETCCDGAQSMSATARF